MAARRISVIIPALTASPSLVALTEQLRRADIFEVLIVSPRKPLNLLTNALQRKRAGGLKFKLVLKPPKVTSFGYCIAIAKFRTVQFQVCVLF